MASSGAPRAIRISPTRSKWRRSSPTSSSTTPPSPPRCCTTPSRIPQTTRAEIDSLFGPDIGTLVEGLTKLKKLDLVTKEAKQAENLRKLLLAIADDVRVLLVKLADRLHNMRTLDYMPVEARRRVAEETLEIYAPLAGRMGMHEMREELEDLAFRELYPEAYAVVSERLDALADRKQASDRRDRAAAHQEARRPRHRRARCRGGASAPIRSGARWSASRSASSSSPTFSASASS